MDILSKIAENKIREAIKNGDLENLPCAGKPLVLEDLSNVPQELRAGYKILKNSGVLPPELELKNEIISLQKLIDYCCDDKEKENLKRKLTEKMLRFDMLMEKRKLNTTLKQYKDKIYNKFG